MKSSWDTTRSRSAYHFDTSIIDPRWDTVIGLGRLSGDWTKETAEAIEHAKPATWETRGYKKQDRAIPNPDLVAEEYDLERVGADPKMTITHMHWDMAPIFQKISDLFAMEDTMNRIHVQMMNRMDLIEEALPEMQDGNINITLQQQYQ